MEYILQVDESLFQLINGAWNNAFLDVVLPYWREKTFWYPAYLILLIFLIYRFRLKGVYLVLAVALTLGLADTASSKGFKKTVKRLRPCNDPAIKDTVVLRVGCGKAYSFTSSHATNHFAMATFLAMTLGFILKRYRWLLYAWAGSIAYAQVYVGVHYPTDVIVGSLLGFLIGWLVAKVYKSLAQIRVFPPPEAAPSV